MPEGNESTQSITVDIRDKNPKKKGTEKADTKPQEPQEPKQNSRSTPSTEDTPDKKRRRRRHGKKDGAKKADTKPQEPQKPKRQRRGGLQRAYGWFRCNECRKHWTSAWVFRVRGTQKVVYKQACKACDIFIFPYNNECLFCREPTCFCMPKQHHNITNLTKKKPHEAKYCEKCLSGWPCGSSER